MKLNQILVWLMFSMLKGPTNRRYTLYPTSLAEKAGDENELILWSYTTKVISHDYTHKSFLFLFILSYSLFMNHPFFPFSFSFLQYIGHSIRVTVTGIGSVNTNDITRHKENVTSSKTGAHIRIMLHQSVCLSHMVQPIPPLVLSHKVWNSTPIPYLCIISIYSNNVSPSNAEPFCADIRKCMSLAGCFCCYGL